MKIYPPKLYRVPTTPSRPRQGRLWPSVDDDDADDDENDDDDDDLTSDEADPWSDNQAN